MVLDTSAILAILQAEPDAASFAAAIRNDPRRLLSAATLVETDIVIEARHGDAGARELDTLLRTAEVETMAVTAEQAQIAREAWRRFGKGRHAAGLNFGDCFSYALALETGEPLLCKGNDFAQTDLELVPIPSLGA